MCNQIEDAMAATAYAEALMALRLSQQDEQERQQ